MTDTQWLKNQGVELPEELSGDWRVMEAIARNVIDRKWDILSSHPSLAVQKAREQLMSERNWWKSPEEGDESHTPRVWWQIALAAEAAGDHARAKEARECAETAARNMGAY